MADKMIEEYKGLLERRLKIETELPTLAQGYISQKTIKGKTYHYLQNRVSGKISSQYLKSTEVDSTAESIALRKQYEVELPKLNTRIGELEQAARLLGKNVSRQLMLLKLSAGMDSMEADQKRRSASFASALNAIEGIPISEQTAKDVAQWQEGKKSYLSVFQETLKRYGFTAEV